MYIKNKLLESGLKQEGIELEMNKYEFLPPKDLLDGFEIGESKLDGTIEKAKEGDFVSIFKLSFLIEFLLSIYENAQKEEKGYVLVWGEAENNFDCFGNKGEELIKGRHGFFRIKDSLIDGETIFPSFPKKKFIRATIALGKQNLESIIYGKK